MSRIFYIYLTLAVAVMVLGVKLYIGHQDETIREQREVIAVHAVEQNTTATAHEAIGEIHQIEKEKRENAKVYPNSVGAHRAVF